MDYFEFLRLNRPVIQFSRLHGRPTHEVSCLIQSFAFCYGHLVWTEVSCLIQSLWMPDVTSLVIPSSWL